MTNRFSEYAQIALSEKARREKLIEEMAEKYRPKVIEVKDGIKYIHAAYAEGAANRQYIKRTSNHGYKELSDA